MVQRIVWQTEAETVLHDGSVGDCVNCLTMVKYLLLYKHVLKSARSYNKISKLLILLIWRDYILN